jgi:hypothetical protein
VGEALGISGKTAEKAAAVGEALNKYEEEGDDEAVEWLTKTVNERGFGPAYCELKAKQEKNGAAEPALPDRLGKRLSLFRKAESQLDELEKLVAEIAAGEGGERLREKLDMHRDLEAFRKLLHDAEPASAVCVACKARPTYSSATCPACHNHRWIPRSVWLDLSPEHRADHPELKAVRRGGTGRG